MKLKTLMTAFGIALVTAACQSPATDRLTADVTAPDSLSGFNERGPMVFDSIRPYQRNRSQDERTIVTSRELFNQFSNRSTPPRDSARPYQFDPFSGSRAADIRPADPFNRFKERTAPPRDSARPYQYNPVITRF
jgi:hypothetical protein